MIKVRGRKDLQRDPSSKAIINIDTKALEEYRQKSYELGRVKSMEERVRSLEAKMEALEKRLNGTSNPITN